jgi:uncharacterized protein (DUF1015 family)
VAAILDVRIVGIVPQILGASIRIKLVTRTVHVCSLVDCRCINGNVHAHRMTVCKMRHEKMRWVKGRREAQVFPVRMTLNTMIKRYLQQMTTNVERVFNV